MYSIEQFRLLNKPESLVLTQHSRKRFAERGISIEDIHYVIMTGEIIEHYTDDKPFPSCLIMGYSGERMLHIVTSIDDELIYIITAYAPNPQKWEADGKTRKESMP
ncbi:MAG: DUF4258 domain-containing protein [Clostridiales bacterium]|nr:DUF4258 domain-containing protein [Clostridiales bacterium]